MNYNDAFEPPALREITLRVAKLNGVNLGQGVCLLPSPRLILDSANRAMQKGLNTYAPPQGIETLRQALNDRLHSYNKIPSKNENIVICAGSTGAFQVVCEALLDEGDEVILFRPFYPYHYKMLRRMGFEIKFVEMKYPDWSFDIADVEKAITKKTKFILVNTPQNPTGKVFTSSELEAIGKLCHKHGLLCVTDEVYEYMTYDGREHVSLASLPDMFDKTITIGSYSKTFSITGWRIGFLVAPNNLVDIFRALNDQMYVCAPTPLQHAVAEGIRSLGADFYATRLQEYVFKREMLYNALEKAGFQALKPEGAYYMLAGTSKKFPGMTSEQVSDVLIDKVHLGAVPASDFLGKEVRNDPSRSNFLRFCYAVPDETLESAAVSLSKL